MILSGPGVAWQTKAGVTSRRMGRVENFGDPPPPSPWLCYFFWWMPRTTNIPMCRSSATPGC